MNTRGLILAASTLLAGALGAGGLVPGPTIGSGTVSQWTNASDGGISYRIRDASLNINASGISASGSVTAGSLSATTVTASSTLFASSIENMTRGIVVYPTAPDGGSAFVIDNQGGAIALLFDVQNNQVSRFSVGPTSSTVTGNLTVTGRLSGGADAAVQIAQPGLYASFITADAVNATNVNASTLYGATCYADDYTGYTIAVETSVTTPLLLGPDAGVVIRPGLVTPKVVTDLLCLGDGGCVTNLSLICGDGGCSTVINMVNNPPRCPGFQPLTNDDAGYRCLPVVVQATYAQAPMDFVGANVGCAADAGWVLSTSNFGTYFGCVNKTTFADRFTTAPAGCDAGLFATGITATGAPLGCYAPPSGAVPFVNTLVGGADAGAARLNSNFLAWNGDAGVWVASSSVAYATSAATAAAADYAQSPHNYYNAQITCSTGEVLTTDGDSYFAKTSYVATAGALATAPAGCDAGGFATGVTATGAPLGCYAPTGTYALPAASGSLGGIKGAGGVTLCTNLGLMRGWDVNGTASCATNAPTSTYATSAGTADHATTANSATLAQFANTMVGAADAGMAPKNGQYASWNGDAGVWSASRTFTARAAFSGTIGSTVNPTVITVSVPGVAPGDVCSSGDNAPNGFHASFCRVSGTDTVAVLLVCLSESACVEPADAGASTPAIWVRTWGPE